MNDVEHLIADAIAEWHGDYEGKMKCSLATAVYDSIKHLITEKEKVEVMTLNGETIWLETTSPAPTIT